MKRPAHVMGAATAILLGALVISVSTQEQRPATERPAIELPVVSAAAARDGQQLFEHETFGGNGRTCLTCHSRETGTVSPQDAQFRFQQNPNDPLFLHDGSDDGHGNGVTRMLADATILVEIQLPPNVRLADDPNARSVTLRRGIPTTLNTPALDPILMQDGRQPSLEAQAQGAIFDHTQTTVVPDADDLTAIKDFQLTDAFFSSPALRDYARGGPAPVLPVGTTDSERRGRRFFEDLPPGPAFKDGLCAACHSGPLLNQTNKFLPIPGVLPGSRFQTVGISELNVAGNPVREYIFTNPDGTETSVFSADPGRALVTGVGKEAGTFDNVNAFKISPLWGIRRTAPYFHDNSAKTLEAVAAHYALFFSIITDPDGPGPAQPLVALTPQDQADIVAYMKLLN
jgi:cytochrome c peroxidase